MALPRMTPKGSDHLLRFVGDRLEIKLELPQGVSPGMRGFLRTNLTRARVARREVVAKAGLRGEEQQFTFAGASWRDIPLREVAGGFAIDLPLLEVGHFRAKAYCVDGKGAQFWPEGGDLGVSVHPNRLRSANTVYCAFPRTFGSTDGMGTIPGGLEDSVRRLDEHKWTLIPPSGTLRGLKQRLPHVFDTLGCRILHLLPIGPVPTTYARMGRYGSPYAQLDLIGIDPALVEFDRRTTAVDQFRELSDAVHLRDGMVLLDIVLNHTGWGSRLFEEHPSWFLRNEDGTFHSPGAWGNTWADLVELDQKHSELWDVLADSLVTWCRRGVDGFRCDAGYMVPLPAWQYVVARVRKEYPDAVFLLEGLGGAWEATEKLLTEGGMQWAYSELFQCYEPRAVAHYLDHANAQSRRIGTLFHYSETHDNDRLALKGERWSSMRNHLCALTSHHGGFGFSAGVEWLCQDKFLVHDARPLRFGAEDNLVGELGRLNGLLDRHPCFFDGADVERVSDDDSHVLAVQRTSEGGLDHCLVLVNLDANVPAEIQLAAEVWQRGGTKSVDLLGQPMPIAEPLAGRAVRLLLGPGQSYCLASSHEPEGLFGDAYRATRAQAEFAYAALGAAFAHESLGPADFRALAQLVHDDATGFLGSLSALDEGEAHDDLLTALAHAKQRARYPRVVTWSPADARRVTLLPPDHWLLVRDQRPFALHLRDGDAVLNLRSTPVASAYVAAVPPAFGGAESELALVIDRFGDAEHPTIHATLRKLARLPVPSEPSRDGLVLLTNGRGAMTRLWADLGSVQSKYDCLLAANLHPDVPVDRHVLAKRVRVWANADGFITPLNATNLIGINAGKTAVWTFAANAGDGRQVGVRMYVELLEGLNALVLRFERVPTQSRDLPADRSLRLTLRFDLEDRSFHADTRANPALERHFEASTHTLKDGRGFTFTPEGDRSLSVSVDRGHYHEEPEWQRDIFHSLESARGLAAHGDAFSPGWFDLPLQVDSPVTVLVHAEREEPAGALVQAGARLSSSPHLETDRFETALRRAADAFLVRRDKGRTVIAGYPWFLDWGRDTLIAVRGLIAAGYVEEARQIVVTFAAMEQGGTLPNILGGEGALNRDTSDAPLWLGLACEELAGVLGQDLYAQPVDGKRSLLDVLDSIAEHYLRGTSNGVSVDHASGLVFSPPHYTWMDTNYPAGTPREGYPIELSVKWACLTRQLARLGRSSTARPYAELTERTRQSLDRFYWPERGYFGDTLHGPRGTPASEAVLDDHLRPNQLLAISLGMVEGERARSAVEAVTRHLLVPGAIRTLAPLPVSYALPVAGRDGRWLNDPNQPYWGRYEGDEDTRRKPAYHNGTAWVWWLGTYCEALARAWPTDPAASAAARSVLGSTARLLSEGCLGQLPEILDGDAPHAQRGCDAQAWSVTETLRVWLLLADRARPSLGPKAG